jgi:uncharacterized repeat protein (TIGR04138 family)
MAPDWPVDRDVECTKCGYNVRTLAVTGRCTECGFPVLRSFIAHEAGVRRGGPPQVERLTKTALHVLARLLGRNRDAIGFVLLAQRHAVNRAMGDLPRLLPPPRVSVPAAALCRALAEVAPDHYGNREDALATLRFWRVERSEDVGQIVAGLLEAGLLAPGPDDHPGDFVGLGLIADMIPKARQSAQPLRCALPANAPIRTHSGLRPHVIPALRRLPIAGKRQRSGPGATGGELVHRARAKERDR